MRSRVESLLVTEARDAAKAPTWSIEQAGKAFTTAALTGMAALLLAAALLAHGTVADEPWAHAAGALTLVGVALAQLIVRRKVLVALTQHHLELGRGEVQARQRARSTLEAWLS